MISIPFSTGYFILLVPQQVPDSKIWLQLENQSNLKDVGCDFRAVDCLILNQNTILILAKQGIEIWCFNEMRLTHQQIWLNFCQNIQKWNQFNFGQIYKKRQKRSVQQSNIMKRKFSTQRANKRVYIICWARFFQRKMSIIL